MARVIVLADHEHPRVSGTFMDETVMSVHLNSNPSAEQFIERLAWAIQDAEDVQRRFVQALRLRPDLDVSSS